MPGWTIESCLYLLEHCRQRQIEKDFENRLALHWSLGAAPSFRDQNTHREPVQTGLVRFYTNDHEPSPLYGFVYPEEMYLPHIAQGH